jgi:hypothetical protein
MFVARTLSAGTRSRARLAFQIASACCSKRGPSSATQFRYGEAVPHQQVARASHVVERVVGVAAVVVEPASGQPPRDPLQVAEAVGQLVDVQRPAGSQHTPELLQARVGVDDMLEHAARQDGLEVGVVVGQPAGLGRRDVGLDVGKPLETLQPVGIGLRPVVERGHGQTRRLEQMRDLPPAAAPVQHGCRCVASDARRDRLVLAHLRARPEIDVRSALRDGLHRRSL